MIVKGPLDDGSAALGFAWLLRGTHLRLFLSGLLDALCRSVPMLWSSLRDLTNKLLEARPCVRNEFNFSKLHSSGFKPPRRDFLMSNQTLLPQPLSPGHQIYADLMDEARIRIHAIRDIINMRDLWAPRLLQEFVYLQLRALCETIALGCLVAHGDIKNRSTLKKWDIPAIMKEMEKLNPDFYPRAVRIRFIQGGGVHLDDHNVPTLTKSELIKLWERSGGMVHRGSAKDLLAAQGSPIVMNLDPVINSGQKILNLLEQHIISSADKKSHLLAALSHVESGGRSSVWVAVSP
jgi:hypothetical protein